MKPIEERSLTDEEIIHGFDVIVWAFESVLAYPTYADKKGLLPEGPRHRANVCHDRRKGRIEWVICKRRRSNALNTKAVTVSAKAEKTRASMYIVDMVDEGK